MSAPMGLVLHEHPLSPCVHKVEIALSEKGRPFDRTMPTIGSPLAGWLERPYTRPSVGATCAAPTSAMNGFGMLPQLVESGVFKRESRDHRPEWMHRSGGADLVLAGMRKNDLRCSREFE